MAFLYGFLAIYRCCDESDKPLPDMRDELAFGIAAKSVINIPIPRCWLICTSYFHIESFHNVLKLKISLNLFERINELFFYSGNEIEIPRNHLIKNSFRCLHLNTITQKFEEKEAGYLTKWRTQL